MLTMRLNKCIKISHIYTKMYLFRDRFSTHLKQNCHIGHNMVKIVAKSGTCIYFCNIMKRKLILTITILVAVAAILFGLICSLSSQTDLTIDNPDGPLCTIPVSDSRLMVEVMPGLKFKLDTGSDISTISPSDLAFLDSLGYKATKSFYISPGRDGRGDMQVETTRYTLSLPIAEFRFQTDSLGSVKAIPTGHIVNVIHNIDFVPSRTGVSVLGIDFIEQFKLEFHYDTKSISLYRNVPEGYQKITEIEPSPSPIDKMLLGNRYYMTIKTERKRDRYFIDTGIRNARIKLPARESIRSHRDLSDTIIVSTRGEFPGKIDNNAWLIFGDRAGSYQVCYYDNDEEEYAINPLNLFDQDIILDFEGNAMLLRPYSSQGEDDHSVSLSSIKGVSPQFVDGVIEEMEAKLLNPDNN